VTPSAPPGSDADAVRSPGSGPGRRRPAQVRRDGGKTTPDRDANLLGALGLVITDRTADAVATAAGASVSGAAALSALHHFLDSPSLDRLRLVLGLTPSGAVRLVDRLAAAGYVTRGAGADGRSRAVTLTPKGQRVAAKVSAERAELLNGALTELSTEERETLHSLMGRLMDYFVRGNLERGPGKAGWICRLCDTTACGRTDGHCPTANSAAAHLNLPPPGSGTPG
jgi:DNA-binding MarR family transcriptional regulator